MVGLPISREDLSIFKQLLRVWSCGLLQRQTPVHDVPIVILMLGGPLGGVLSLCL